MKKYQLTEDMACDRKYWMTKTLATLHKETVKKRKNVFENKNPFNQNKLPTVARVIERIRTE